MLYASLILMWYYYQWDRPPTVDLVVFHQLAKSNVAKGVLYCYSYLKATRCPVFLATKNVHYWADKSLLLGSIQTNHKPIANILYFSRNILKCFYSMLSCNKLGSSMWVVKDYINVSKILFHDEYLVFLLWTYMSIRAVLGFCFTRSSNMTDPYTCICSKLILLVWMD